MVAAVVVDVVRTPVGGRHGALSGWHPVDLAAACLTALQQRNDLDPALVDDVILGCVMQIGAQSVNVARSAALAAGWPAEVPGTTIERQCTSAQQAVHFAAQGLASGAYGLVVAGGVEIMSLVPLGATVGQGFGAPFGPTVARRYEDRGGLVPLGVAAESVAERYGLDRAALDGFALASHQRAAAARDGGRFAGEIVAIPIRRGVREGGLNPVAKGLLQADETIRAVSAEELAALRPSFVVGGRITAGNSACIADGASAALLASEAIVQRLGLRARAVVTATAARGSDPLLMVTGAVPATEAVLARAGLDLAAIDVFEVHESSAAAVLAWLAEVGADPERVNPNGGAIALGHPLGSSGTRSLATLLAELERREARRGLQVMAGLGGVSTALIIERA